MEAVHVGLERREPHRGGGVVVKHPAERRVPPALVPRPVDGAGRHYHQLADRPLPTAEHPERTGDVVALERHLDRVQVPVTTLMLNRLVSWARRRLIQSFTYISMP